MKCQAAPGGAAQQRNGYEDHANLQPGEQHHDEAGGRNQQGRAQIRLRHDHRRRNGDQDPHDDQVLEGRRQRAFVHVPGAYHRYRELHDLGGLKAHEADVEPALRALADVAGHFDHDQQQHADDIGDRREQAQVLRSRELGERQHGGHRDGDIHQMMLDHFPVLPGRAVDHQNADHTMMANTPVSGPSNPKRAQGAAAGGQGAAGSRGENSSNIIAYASTVPAVSVHAVGP